MISTGSWPTTHAGETAHTFFRPAVILSYAADMAIWGPRPSGFRLTNLLLHILCTLLVHRIARSEGLGDAAALAAGALFAAHPAHVESVAWISGRTDLLCAAFMLGAWLHYRRGRTAAGLCLFGLALLSKEMAITLPLLIAADARPRLRGAAPWAAVAVLFLIARALILGAPPAPAYALEPQPFLATALVVLARYVGLMAGFTGLGASWWETPVEALADPRALLSALLLVALTVAIWRVGRAGFWLFWMLVTLLPVLALGRFGDAVMAERFVYIPSVGLCLAAAWAVRWRVARLAAAAVTACFAVMTAVRASAWTDDARLFASLAASAPESALVRANYGLALLRGGDPAGAERELRASLARAPVYGLAHQNLGLALEAQGRDAEALRAYGEAAADPTLIPAQVNAALLMVRMGRADEGLAALGRLAAVHPDVLFAHAEALDRAGRKDEALARAWEAVAADPFDARPHYLIGKLLYERGELPAAADAMRLFLELSPRPGPFDEPARQVIERAPR